MSYRIESASTGRATCKNKECKDNNIKIGKGELRFGVWVDIQGHGSFAWKHWGCVTGFQLLNLQKYLKQGDDDGPYQWDFFDGLDELSPADQTKIKTAVEVGKIADEDWRGDPEYNVLGQKGTRAPVRKPKKSQDDESGEGEETKDGSPEKKKPAAKKRGKKADAEDDDEEVKPKPAKRAKKVKDEVKSEDETPAAPVKKGRKRVKKEAVKFEDEAESKTGIKNEHSDVEDVKPAPKKRGAAKKAAVKAEANSDDEVKPAPKKRGAAAKKVKAEVKSADESDAPAEKKPAPKKARAAAKKAKVPSPESDEEKPAPAGGKRGGRARKAVNYAEVNEDGSEAKSKSKKRGGKKSKAAVSDSDIEQVWKGAFEMGGESEDEDEDE